MIRQWKQTKSLEWVFSKTIKKKTFEKGLGIEEGGGNEYGGRKHPN